MAKVKTPGAKSAAAHSREPFLESVARRVVEVHGAAPGAVVAVAVRRGARWKTAVGAAGTAKSSTIFDLASVTKPVTALLAARLVRRGIVGWSTRLGEVLALFERTPAGRLPLDLLLAHRAGLEAHLPLFAQHVDRMHVDRAHADRARIDRGSRAHRAMLLEAAHSGRRSGKVPVGGFPPVYSDMGYLLAGQMLARIGGKDLDDLFAHEVLGPLDLEGQVGSVRRLRLSVGARSFARRVAPTEVVAWRGGIVRGEVHDENAWVFGGDATCGHAGLFATGTGLVALGRAILDARAGRLPGWLGPADLEPLLRRRRGGTLRAGFDGKSAKGSSAGNELGPETFGHLGFTGTSLWMDPERELVAVLLTNRVHPTRKNQRIRRARPEVYDAIARWSEHW